MLNSLLTTLFGRSTGPSLDLNFLTGAMPAGVTFSRPGGATSYDATGTLQTAATNAPRIDYGPTPGGVTNWTRNSQGVGGTPGSPGTDPTYWNLSGNSGLPSGLNKQIVAQGTLANGTTYTDVRYYGTPTTGTNFFPNFDATVAYVLSATQPVTISGSFALIAGSLANIVSLYYVVNFTGNNAAVNLAPTLNGTLKQYTVTNTPGAGSTTANGPFLNITYTANNPIDFTIRCAGIQYENAAMAGVYVPTSGTPANSGAVPLGLLIEEQRTNNIRNPRFEGGTVFSGTPAKLVATISGGAVTGITIVDGGSGYASAPTMAFSGGGSPTTPAAATATLTGGVITGVTITNGGAGYTLVPAINPYVGGLPSNMAGGGFGTIVGKGTESGIPYIDVRLRGNSGSAYCDFQLDILLPAAAQGQTWTLSSCVRLIAGSWANIGSAGLILYGAPGFNDNGSVSILTATGAPLATQRFSKVWTFGNAGTNGISPRFTFTPIGDFDITLRLGAPQLEQGAFATSLILPPPAAPAVTTRVGDNATVPVGGWFNASAFSLVVEGMSPQVQASGIEGLAVLDDTTAANRVTLRLINTLSGAASVVSGAATAQPSGAAYTANTVFKTGYVANGGLTIATNGTINTTQSGALPAGLTTLRLGQNSNGGSYLDGYIRRVRYWPRTLSNTELRQVTT
jgi:hypothetical protein